jgi:hypothetical protein
MTDPLRVPVVISPAYRGAATLVADVLAGTPLERLDLGVATYSAESVDDVHELEQVIRGLRRLWRDDADRRFLMLAAGGVLWQQRRQLAGDDQPPHSELDP